MEKKLDPVLLLTSLCSFSYTPSVFPFRWNKARSFVPIHLSSSPLVFSFSSSSPCLSFPFSPPARSPRCRPLHAQQCVKNSSADEADLSFCHAGRLWNSLAPASRGRAPSAARYARRPHLVSPPRPPRGSRGPAPPTPPQPLFQPYL